MASFPEVLNFNRLFLKLNHFICNFVAIGWLCQVTALLIPLVYKQSCGGRHYIYTLFARGEVVSHPTPLFLGHGQGCFTNTHSIHSCLPLETIVLLLLYAMVLHLVFLLNNIFFPIYAAKANQKLKKKLKLKNLVTNSMRN